MLFLDRWAEGTTHLRFDPLELLERLAVLTPRPRVNLILYYGVLAPLRAVCETDGPFRTQSFKILSRSIRPSNRQPPNAISRVFDEDQRARFQIGGTFVQNHLEPLIH